MKQKVVFMMSGSIACFKACEVISMLNKKGLDVQCAISESTPHFIGRSTLEGLSGNPVLDNEYESGRNMDHIHLMHQSDLIVLCPATAKTINQMAHGVGGLLSTLFLAHDFQRPFLVYPAMNTAMYQHPTTQACMEKLKSMGLQIRPTGTGDLACGEEGYGRLLEPRQIFEEILEQL